MVECLWWEARLANGRTVGVEARRVGGEDWAVTVGGVTLPHKVEGSADAAEHAAWRAVVERHGMVREWLVQGEQTRDALLADLARLRDLAHGPETPAETLDRLARAAAEMATTKALYRGAVVLNREAAAKVRALTTEVDRLRAIEAAAGALMDYDDGLLREAYDAQRGDFRAMNARVSKGVSRGKLVDALRAALAGKGGA
jgi:hypothetical protein